MIIRSDERNLVPQMSEVWRPQRDSKRATRATLTSGRNGTGVGVLLLQDVGVNPKWPMHCLTSDGASTRVVAP